MNHHARWPTSFSVRRFNDLDGREDIGTRTSGSTSDIDAAV